MHMINVYLVSDSSGETVETVLRAAIHQFSELAKVKEHLWTMIRSHTLVNDLLIEVEKNNGMILYTMAYNDIRSYLIDRCNELGIVCLCPLESVVHALKNFISHNNQNIDLQKIELQKAPGKYLKLDDHYYARIQSLYFTLNHDDGCNMQTANTADIILFGVSRTSKTPISLYLAHRGYRVANIPVIFPGFDICLNQILESISNKQMIKKPLMIGLIIASNSLTKLRNTRHENIYSIQNNNCKDSMNIYKNQIDPYIDEKSIYEELSQAKQLFRKFNINIIDVTRKAIEEVAAEITAFIKE